jgi:outer membrane receptor protein involved in Fe transport
MVGAWVSLAPLGGGLRVTVEGKNLGDRRVSDVGGFPLPGRSLFVSFEARLGAHE